MPMLILGGMLFFWGILLVSLILTRKELFSNTWNEPYLEELAVLLESDDWGPGEDYHAQRLSGLIALLENHRDSLGRPPVLTADMVLAVPDTKAIRSHQYAKYARSSLDSRYKGIMKTLQAGISKGVLVPQLHGLEHLHGAGFVKLGRDGDTRVAEAFNSEEWSDWESLDSPLQAHYVDGSRLPTTPLPHAERQSLISQACESFNNIFGMPSLSTVAPCYLWDDDVEHIWAQKGIRYIQTAGYRCPGRDADGRYIQDLSLIRPGQRNHHGQIYLVRNAMYEPVDNRRDGDCLLEIYKAHQQGLPAVISTHRYNFTRSEEEYLESLSGLDRLLGQLESRQSNLRYLSSPELGTWFEDKSAPCIDPATGRVWPALKQQRGMQKLRSFLFRLWHRHHKLRVLAIVTAIILPLGLITMPGWRIFRRWV